MRIAVIGAGAAGCFAAVNIARMLPGSRITIYESGMKTLAKVAVTGGGRCNLTNSFNAVKSTEAAYPRGARLMKRLMHVFSHRDTMQWFENEGVRLVTQDDGCVFPASQDAMEIVGTLRTLARLNGVNVRLQHRAESVRRTQNGYAITFTQQPEEEADIVVVTTGGSPKAGGLRFLDPLNLDIVAPVPSLFSMNIGGDDLHSLAGTVVKNVTAGLAGTKIRTGGPLLITHWGMSGPAVLKLSAFAARILNENAYTADIIINWFGDMRDCQVAALLEATAAGHPQKMLQSVTPEQFNSRLWNFLLHECGINGNQRWAELGKKSINRMAATLTAHTFRVTGKCRWKEEFVTCGGVALTNVSPSTLEAREHPGLYFAGEVLDIDAVTGGFNLQAAWTTAYVVAKSISEKKNNV